MPNVRRSVPSLPRFVTPMLTSLILEDIERIRKISLMLELHFVFFKFISTQLWWKHLVVAAGASAAG